MLGFLWLFIGIEKWLSGVAVSFYLRSAKKYCCSCIHRKCTEVGNTIRPSPTASKNTAGLYLRRSTRKDVEPSPAKPEWMLLQDWSMATRVGYRNLPPSTCSLPINWHKTRTSSQKVQDYVKIKLEKSKHTHHEEF